MEPDYLSQLRADQTALLEQSGLTATVITGTPARSELGGITVTPGSGETYPCRVQYDEDPQEKTGAAQRRRSQDTWIVFLPWNAEVGASQQLEIEDQRYLVTGTNARESDRLTLDVFATVVK